MAQLSSLESDIVSTRDSDDTVSRLAGYGSIFGFLAAVLGLFAGISLVPIPSIVWEQTSVSPFEWVLGGNTQT
ncbi:MAG: hypothetical protein ACXAB5_08045, partial [Candidatus Thorarchaeota archaeon]